MTKLISSKNARSLVMVALAVMLFLNACSVAKLSPDNLTVNKTNLESQLAPMAVEELPKAAVLADMPAAIGGAAQLKAAPAQPNLSAGAALQSVPAQGAAVQPAAPPANLQEMPPAIDLALPVQPRVGARAPEFSLQTLDGQSLNLAGLIGHPVVVSYWATWCIPCQQELPILQSLSQEYQSTGLVVLTVNAIDQDSVDKIQTMLTEKGLNLPVLLDQGSSFAQTYEAVFFPTTFYIDPAGVIRFIKLGDSSEADLRAHVEGLLRGDL